MCLGFLFHKFDFMGCQSTTKAAKNGSRKFSAIRYVGPCQHSCMSTVFMKHGIYTCGPLRVRLIEIVKSTNIHCLQPLSHLHLLATDRPTYTKCTSSITSICAPGTSIITTFYDFSVDHIGIVINTAHT